MKNEFINYNQALKLKELGFDEPCFGYYSEGELIFNSHTNNYMQRFRYSAPTFSQAFRWFREKYSLCIVIKPIDDKKLELGYNLTKNGLIMGAYTLYDVAESACLDKLIEIVENK